MNKRPLRILFPSEFTGINTGFSTYTKELLQQLYSTGRFSLCELACYCRTDNPQHAEIIKNTPWKVIPVITPGNNFNEQEYLGTPTAEFGSLKFEQACLDFQPDVVISITDPWMHAYIDQSPFRRMFRTIFMPTIDAECLQDEWLDLYQRMDYILNYTEFGERTLREESGNTVNLCGTASPAVDINTFKFIQNKAEHKEKMGLRGDSIIVGMVARNQRRKLFPALCDSFVDFLHRLNLEGTDNVFLYLHSSYPDLGWSLPSLIKQAGLSHKVLFTFKCQNCKLYFPNFYRDVISFCPRCKQAAVSFANSQDGVTRQELADIYNVMDLYVQYANIEGAGVPLMEAACCGLPVAATDYSGMESIIRNVGGFPIPVKLYQIEVETGRKISIPDDQALAEYIQKFVYLPASTRLRMGYNTHVKAVNRYGSWKDVANKWISIFDQITPPEANQWLSSIDYMPVENLPPCPDPRQINDEQFITWALSDILHRNDWSNTHIGLKLGRDLIYGSTSKNYLGFMSNEMSSLGGSRQSWEKCDRNVVYGYIKNMRNKINHWELARLQFIRENKIK